MPLGHDGNVAIQGFAPNPTLSQEFTIGTDTTIDVTGWVAVRWNSQDGSSLVKCLLNDNTVGRTLVDDVFVVTPAVTAISFTGTAGVVVEVEGMK